MQGQAVLEEVAHGFEELHLEVGAQQRAEDGKLQLHAIPPGQARLVLEEQVHGDDGEQEDNEQQPPPGLEEVAERQQPGHDGGHFAAGALEQDGELRQQVGDEHDAQRDAGGDDEGGIDQRAGRPWRAGPPSG